MVVVAILALLLALLRLLVFVFDFETSALVLEASLVLNGWWGGSIDIDIGSLLTRREIVELRRMGNITSLGACLAVAMTHGVPAAAYQLARVALAPSY